DASDSPLHSLRVRHVERKGMDTVRSFGGKRSKVSCCPRADSDVPALPGEPQRQLTTDAGAGTSDPCRATRHPPGFGPAVTVNFFVHVRLLAKSDTQLCYVETRRLVQWTLFASRVDEF